MTTLGLLGAAVVLSTALATPALAQQVIYNPGYCAQFYPNANCQNLGPGNPYTGSYQRGAAYRSSYNRWDDDRRTNRRTGFWPGDVAAGVVGGALATAGAIASAPFRGSDSYAYYGGPAPYDDSYAYYGNRPARTTCGLQPGATYMGPDGRWYPC
jgi:hypothetical protein